MIDQLTIGDVKSYDDFGASVRERSKKAPKKKSIKDTVPFSNTTYDFTAINGEIYWEERELEYICEITASSPEELEEKKMPFIKWIMNIQEEEIHDPFIKNYHFTGTFSDIEEDDGEFEKSTIKVVFTAYPYMIANEPKEYTLSMIANGSKSVTVSNESAHKITPTVISDVSVTIKTTSSTYSIPAGTTTSSSFQLEQGETELVLETTEAGNVTLRFYEEVF